MQRFCSFSELGSSNKNMNLNEQTRGRLYGAVLVKVKISKLCIRWIVLTLISHSQKYIFQRQYGLRVSVLY